MQSAKVMGGQYFVGGDLIIGLDGKKIRTREDLIEGLGSYRVGENVKLTIVRDERMYEADVLLQPID